MSNEDYERREALRRQLYSIPGMREKLGLGKKPVKTNGADGGDAETYTMPPTPEEPPPPASAAEKPPEKPHDHQIAEDILSLLSRFIVAQEFELHLIALWILLTHTFLLIGAAYVAYLVVCSAEKGSGKTRVLEVVKWLVRMPLMTASISPAALARTVHEEHCTFLLDEYDTVYGKAANKELAEAIKAILNSGFHIAGAYTRMVGVGAAMHPYNFSTFGPKALDGLGIDVLPDTVVSRSFVIRMKRALRGQCERFRPDGMNQSSKALRSELEALRMRAAKWAQRHAPQIANYQPAIPGEFTDRQADISEPILAIAQVLGSPWPECINQALSKVFASPAAQDSSKKVLLLGHIRKLFLDKFDNNENPDADRWQLRTETLIEGLSAIAEAPWMEWNRGKWITPRQLAKLLREFELNSRLIRDPVPVRGYKMVDFRDAFSRYLPPVCLCPGCTCHEACNGACNGSEIEVSANNDAGCNPVTAKIGGTRARGEEGPSKTVN